eukprot:scaffold57992_cov20-Tisochrysis_lutea.AAC.7
MAPPPRGLAAAQKHAQRMRMRSMSPDSCPTSVRGGFAPGVMARGRQSAETRQELNPWQDARIGSRPASRSRA